MWKPSMNGDRDSYELSCVHTDDEIGFDSWGWEGPYKVIIITGGDPEDGGDGISKKRWEKIEPKLMVLAQSFCDILNVQYPDGIDNGDD